MDYSSSAYSSDRITQAISTMAFTTWVSRENGDRYHACTTTKPDVD